MKARRILLVLLLLLPTWIAIDLLLPTKTDIRQFDPKFRAAAMDIRDSEQEKDGVSEGEWQQIADLLNQSWQSLYNNVIANGK